MSLIASSSTIALIMFAFLVPQKPGAVRRPTAPGDISGTGESGQ